MNEEGRKEGSERKEGRKDKEGTTCGAVNNEQEGRKEG